MPRQVTNGTTNLEHDQQGLDNLATTHADMNIVLAKIILEDAKNWPDLNLAVLGEFIA